MVSMTVISDFAVTSSVLRSYVTAVTVGISPAVRSYFVLSVVRYFVYFDANCVLSVVIPETPETK